MKKYSIAVNSIIFVISLMIGISVINIALKPSNLEKFVQNDQALRVVNIGEILSINPYSFNFKYISGSRTNIARIEITDDTEFHTSKILLDDGVIYGREVKKAKRSDMLVGRKVVVDWIFQEGRNYTATNITFVASDLSTLLY